VLALADAGLDVAKAGAIKGEFVLAHAHLPSNARRGKIETSLGAHLGEAWEVLLKNRCHTILARQAGNCRFAKIRPMAPPGEGDGNPGAAGLGIIV
jgi:hypothetical protein